jgi:hypothetical protein
VRHLRLCSWREAVAAQHVEAQQAGHGAQRA